MTRLRFSPDELATVVACADAGSFSAAAARVHRTQSTVSGQVVRIEQRLGAPVFERTARGVTPTAQGGVLIVYARRMLALQDEMSRALAGAEIGGRVRLGISEYVVPQRLGDLVRRVEQRYPRLVLHTSVSQTARLQALLADGALDLVVGTCVGDPGTGRSVLAVDPLGWVAAERRVFQAGDVVPLVLLDASCGLHQHALRALARSALTPRVAVVASSALGVHAAVAAGLGIGCLNRGATPSGLVRLSRASGLPGLDRHSVFLERADAPPGRASAIDAVAQAIEQALRARPSTAL